MPRPRSSSFPKPSDARLSRSTSPRGSSVFPRTHLTPWMGEQPADALLGRWSPVLARPRSVGSSSSLSGPWSPRATRARTSALRRTEPEPEPELQAHAESSWQEPKQERRVWLEDSMRSIRSILGAAPSAGRPEGTPPLSGRYAPTPSGPPTILHANNELRVDGAGVGRDRMIAVQNLFEHLLEEFRSFQPLLSQIKAEYDAALSHWERVREETRRQFHRARNVRALMAAELQQIDEDHTNEMRPLLTAVAQARASLERGSHSCSGRHAELLALRCRLGQTQQALGESAATDHDLLAVMRRLERTIDRQKNLWSEEGKAIDEQRNTLLDLKEKIAYQKRSTEDAEAECEQSSGKRPRWTCPAFAPSNRDACRRCGQGSCIRRL